MSDTERGEKTGGMNLLEETSKECARLREQLQDVGNQLGTLRRVHEVAQAELQLARQRARRPWANDEALEELVLQLCDAMELLAKFCGRLPPHEVGPRLARWSDAIARARGRHSRVEPLAWQGTDGDAPGARGSSVVGSITTDRELRRSYNTMGGEGSGPDKKWPCD